MPPFQSAFGPDGITPLDKWLTANLNVKQDYPIAYFITGAIEDPKLLKAILSLDSSYDIRLQAAQIEGFMTAGTVFGWNKAMSDKGWCPVYTGDVEDQVLGMAIYILTAEQEENLAGYYGEEFECHEVKIKHIDYHWLGAMFWNEDATKDYKVEVGRTFVYIGSGGVGPESETDGAKDDEMVIEAQDV